MGRTGGGPRLLVNCHLDTQPADLGEHISVAALRKTAQVYAVAFVEWPELASAGIG